MAYVTWSTRSSRDYSLINRLFEHRKMTAVKKFVFPARGFHLVADKVAEADYFLEQMKDASGRHAEFRYLFSAFLSASRSITFALQAVLRHYPGFEQWYPQRQRRLRESRLARFFTDLRNRSQKTGDLPLGFGGFGTPAGLRWVSFFVPSEALERVPAGDVVESSREYLREILAILAECYRDFRPHVDPRAILALEGLAQLGWTVEDLEESLGFPRGWRAPQSGWRAATGTSGTQLDVTLSTN